MTLDIHSRKSREIAHRRKRWAFLDDYVHASLIRKISRVSASNSREITLLRCPLLNRLQNFYEDCSYHSNELEHLIKEVQEIKQEFISDQNISVQLKMFEKACRDAQNGKLNLYVFADWYIKKTQLCNNNRRELMQITIELPQDLEQDLIRQAAQSNVSLQRTFHSKP